VMLEVIITFECFAVPKFPLISDNVLYLSLITFQAIWQLSRHFHSHLLQSKHL
jgi:hypothetical protein